MNDWLTAAEGALTAAAGAPVGPLLVACIVMLAVLGVLVLWPSRDIDSDGVNAVIRALGHDWTNARVRHPEHGYGIVLEPDDMRPGILFVRWDAGPVTAVHETALTLVVADIDDERMWRELRAALDAMDAAAPITAVGHRVRRNHTWCGGPITCDTHHVELCTDRPCCSMCPTREDTTR